MVIEKDDYPLLKVGCQCCTNFKSVSVSCIKTIQNVTEFDKAQLRTTDLCLEIWQFLPAENLKFIASTYPFIC